MPTGPKNDLCDVAGIEVGCASDPAALTGVTVILPDRPAVCAVDLRGGGPGTRETDALRLDGLVDRADAIVLAGGSVYGLAAADAVTAALGAEGRGFALSQAEGVPVSPIVPAAILYDLNNGGRKDWGATPPYAFLGRAAFGALADEVPLGRVGAGAGATAGAHPGGQGSASWIEGGVTLSALAAVNSFGSPYVPGTDHFWAAPFEVDGEFGGRGVAQAGGPVTGLPSDTKLAAPRANTTLAVIATDAALSKAECRRVAIMAQDGLARAIRPAHGPTDGDVVFVLATGRVPLPEPRLRAVLELGTAAGDVLARAIARGVHASRI